MYLVFIGLKLTNYCFPQLFITWRSSFKLLKSVSMLSVVNDLHRAVSSAKRKISVCKSSVISLKYMRNNKGPRIEPCGTPHLIDIYSEVPQTLRVG